MSNKNRIYTEDGEGEILINRMKDGVKNTVDDISNEIYDKDLNSRYNKTANTTVDVINNMRRRPKSIAGMAKNNIFEFPAWISSTVPIEYATAACSLLEMNYASFLQMSISNTPVVNVDDTNGDIFSKWKTDTHNYLEVSDLTYTFDACHNEIVSEDGTMFTFDMLSIPNKDVRIINEWLNYEPLSEFSHYFQESKASRRTVDQLSNENTELKNKCKKLEDTITDLERRMNNLGTTGQHTINNLNKTRKELEEQLDNAKKENEEYKKQIEENQKQIERNQKQIEKLESRKDSVSTATLKKEKLEAENDNAKYQREVNQNTKEILSNMKDPNTGRPYTKDAIETMLNANKMLIEASKARDDAELMSCIKKDKNGNPIIVKDENGRDIYEIDPIHTEDYYKRIAARRDFEAYDSNKNREITKFNKDVTARAPEILDDSKLQKINSLKPTMMNVEIAFNDTSKTSPDGVRQLKYRNFVIGVKIYARIVQADTLPEVVSYPLKEMNELSRKAKYRAGELKFFKDILFRVKQKKQTAIDSKDPKRRWYRRLYELAHMTGDSASVGKLTDNNDKGILKGKLAAAIQSWMDTVLTGTGKYHEPAKSNNNGFIPNATIIISKSDVDFIKSETGIDLLDGGKAKSFCNELFLMNFVVIDFDAQSIMVLTPDLHKDFEIHALSSVNKQLAMLDSSSTTSREIGNLFKSIN